MSKNEIRGYIFMGFALMCLSTWGLGDISSGYIRSSNVLIIFPILAGIFGCISACCFLKAYNEAEASSTIAAPTIMRIGQAWTEFNMFLFNPGKVNANLSDNGETILLDISVKTYNQQSRLQSVDSSITFGMNAIDDTGKEKNTLPILNESTFRVEADRHVNYVYRLEAPKNCDRVLLHFTAKLDTTDEIYEQVYELYPKHYIR